MVENENIKESLERDEASSVVRLTSSIGIALPDGQFRVFLPKGSRLPCEASARFLTRLKEYNKAKIKVFMGDGEDIEDNFFLGEIGLDNVRLNKDGQALLDLIFQADINHLLYVQIKDEPGKKASNVTLPLPREDAELVTGDPTVPKRRKSKQAQMDSEMLVEKIQLLEQKIKDMETEIGQIYKGERQEK